MAVKTRVFGPEVVRASSFVLLVLSIGAITYYSRWPMSPHPTIADALIFAIKAASTSGIPDPVPEPLRWFIIIYVPVAILAWAVFLDSLINRS